MRVAWQCRRDGVPPDSDERTYRWDTRSQRWVALDEPEVDEDALEAWEEKRRERIALQNEF